jgi:hypothetical protein
MGEEIGGGELNTANLKSMTSREFRFVDVTRILKVLPLSAQ